MVQSFEPAVLRDLRALLGEDGPQMIQLVHDDAAGDRMVTRAGPARDLHLRAGHRPQPRAHPRPTGGRSTLVEEAHRAALSVFCWTLRAENAFLPEHLRVGDAPEGLGNALAEARQLLAMGVDGLITDSPDHAVQAVAELLDAGLISATGVQFALLASSAEPRQRGRNDPESGRGPQSIRSWMTTFSSRPGPTPITLIRAPASSSSRLT